MKIKQTLLLCTSLLLINLSNNAFSAELQSVKNQYNNKFQFLEESIDKYSGRLLLNSEKLILAELHKNKGNDNVAIEICKEILEKESNNQYALFLLGEIYKRNYKYQKSIKEFNKITQKQEKYGDSLLELMEIYVSIRDFKNSKIILDKAKKVDKNIYNTALGIYTYTLLLDSKKAQSIFQDVLKKNPDSLDSKYYLGVLNLNINNREEARKDFEELILRNFFDSKSHAYLGYLEFLEGNLDNAVYQFKTALKINPLELRAITSYGTGVTNKNYEDLEKSNPNLKGSEEFISAGKNAVELINSNKMRELDLLIRNLKEKYPDNIHTYIVSGSIKWILEDYNEAINQYQKARKISPDYGVANNGLYVSISGLIDSLKKDNKVFSLGSHKETKELKSVFINYDDLPNKLKKIVTYSVDPLKIYLPILSEVGSTHYIIPLYEKSTDYKYGQQYKGERSFDLRLWDDIRGRGGFHSATSIEDLTDVINFEFNTLTHEFAHQVHGYALTSKEKDKIKQLFLKAKKKNKFMDYYAGSNEYEYFAQGVEAYIAIQGKNTLRSTAKNTRKLLLETDKDLYNYIEYLINKKDLTENYVAGFIQQGLNNYYNQKYEESEKSYKKALEISENNYDVLIQLGNLYVYSKTAEEAKKVHLNAIDIDPKNPEGYVRLGDDEYFISGDYENSFEYYNKALSIDPKFSESYGKLGNAYNFSGDINNSIKYYSMDSKIDPNYYSTFYNLAKNYYINGDTNKSIDNIRKAIKINKNYPDAHSLYSLLLLDQEDLENAKNESELALNLDKTNNLANILNFFFKSKTEDISFKELTGLNYENLNLIDQTRLANVFLSNNDLEEAKYLLDIILKVYLGEENKNKYFFDIKNKPEQAEFYYTLGLLEEKLGNKDKALEYIKKSLDLVPEYSKAKIKLEKMN